VNVLLPSIALALFALSAALWKPLPASRSRFRGGIGFLLLWLILWTGNSAASMWHLRNEVTVQVEIALLTLAGVQVLAGLAFDFAVERAHLPRFAAEMVVVAAYIGIVFHMFYQLGVNVTGIFATSAVATAVIGLALQDMLSNIASGIALEVESDIAVGDFIRCGDAAGWVKHVRLRHTSLETPDGHRILLPNSFLTRSTVTIVPRSHRRFVPFHMPYGCNPQELMDAITRALRASPMQGVAVDPQPHCIITDMGTGDIRYAAVVWILEPGKETAAISVILNRVYFALQRAGLPVGQISQILEFKQADDSATAHLSPSEVLGRTPIFRTLEDVDLARLGASMRRLSFAPGELLLRQGDDGDSMYFVTSGQVAINYVGRDHAEIQVAVITAGEFFGETSLLTGAPRNANAIALTRVDCYELAKQGLQEIMRERVELAEDMSIVMAHRQMELDSTREKLDLETARRREAEQQSQLLARIRRFFGVKTTSAGV
jgi:small-conductance mechanosensitive channel